MSASELGVATPPERDAVALWQAEHWRGPRTAEQYVERNRRLAATPFGARALSTFVLREPSGAPVSSMEALECRISTGDGPRRAYLIGSVVTPPDLRGRGRAA